MKKIIFILFIALSFQNAFAQLDSETVDYEPLAQKMCNLVDALQPGGYHTFDCFNYTEDLVRDRDNLMRYTYMICSESYVSKPWECYSKLARNIFDELLSNQMSRYELNEWFQSRFSNAFREQGLGKLRASDDPEDYAWLQKLWKAQDISLGLELGTMSTGIQYCSILSEKEIVSEKSCFKVLMTELQNKFFD